MTRRIRTSPLMRRNAAAKFGKAVEQGIKEIDWTRNTEDIDETWNQWNKEALIKAAEKVLPVENSTVQRKKCWMTGEILEMMEDRRRIKDRNSEKYRRANKEIVKRCKQEKTKWYTEKCKIIEQLEENNKMQEMHNEVKKMMK